MTDIKTAQEIAKSVVAAIRNFDPGVDLEDEEGYFADLITRHLAAALKERDERLRQRLRRAQSMLELDDPISRSTVRVAIREALRELGEGGSDE